MASAEGAAAKEPEHDVLYQGEAPPLPMVELETPTLGVGREADARLVQELLEREPSLPLGEEIAKLKHIHASEDLRALAEHIEELEALHRTESDHRATASAFLDRLQAMAKRGRQVLLYVGGNKVRAFVSLGAGVGVGAAILIAVSRAPRRRQ